MFRRSNEMNTPKELVMRSFDVRNQKSNDYI